MNLIEKYLGEVTDSFSKKVTKDEVMTILKNRKKRSSDSTPMECMECGHKFRKRLGKNTVEVKCPKCKGYDTEPA